MTQVIKNVGLGILSWKCYDNLQYQLESYKNNGFLKLFEEKIIFFQEIDEEARELAKQYGFNAHGNDKNVGIYEGFKTLSQCMKSEIVLIMENDQTIVVDANESKRQVEIAKKYLENKQAHVVQFLNRVHDEKYIQWVKNKLYWHFPPDNASAFVRFVGWANQTFRKKTLLRKAGRVAEAIDNPHEYYKEIKHDNKTGFFIMPCGCKHLMPRNLMIKNEFFQNVIVKYLDTLDATKMPQKHLVNGFIDLERGLRYKRWWWHQPYTLAVSKGMFDHERIGYRGYD